MYLQTQGQHSDKSLAHIQIIHPMICPQFWQLHKSTDRGGTGGIRLDVTMTTKQGRSDLERANLFSYSASRKRFVLIKQSNHRKGQVQFRAYVFPAKQQKTVFFVSLFPFHSLSLFLLSDGHTDLKRADVWLITKYKSSTFSACLIYSGKHKLIVTDPSFLRGVWFIQNNQQASQLSWMEKVQV